MGPKYRKNKGNIAIWGGRCLPKNIYVSNWPIFFQLNMKNALLDSDSTFRKRSSSHGWTIVNFHESDILVRYLSKGIKSSWNMILAFEKQLRQGHKEGKNVGFSISTIIFSWSSWVQKYIFSIGDIKEKISENLLEWP